MPDCLLSSPAVALGVAQICGFADRLIDHGSRIALISQDGETLSYAALAAAADLVPLPADRCLVALAMTPTFDAIILYLAALRRRYPVILIDAPDSTVGRRICRTYAPWLLGDAPPAAPPAAALHHDLAVMLSTSGSTGSAKLVRLSAANIASNAASIADYLALTPDDCAITSLPLHYSYGLSVLNSHLAVGASIILTDASVNDDLFWALFVNHGATHLAGVPYSYDLFDRRGLRTMALPTLRVLTQAGGRLSPAQVTAYAEWAADRDVNFFVMYGQTEATARMAYLPPALAASHSDCIGIAIPGGDLSIERDGATSRGELIYSGPNVMMGYATEPADLAASPGPPVLRTGDLAEQTDTGMFRIVGRLNRFSKLFGLRISHDELESGLTAQRLNTLVTGDDEAVAVIVEGVVPADLVARLAGQTGLPASVIRVSSVTSLPRFASGKPDYATARRLAAAAAPPPASNDVAAVFAAAFPNSVIEPDTSFNTLGGDSLNYVGFALALEDVIGPLPADWPEWTLARLQTASAALPARLPHTTAGWRNVDSDIVIRAAAICAIVLVHTRNGMTNMLPSTGIGGGAISLMILFGFNMARFQRSRLFSVGRWQVVADFSLRVILPYFILLLSYSIYRRTFSLANFLMVSNYFGRFNSLLEPYWFLETALQGVIFMALLASIPPVSALARRNLSLYTWLLIGIALLIKVIGVAALDSQALAYRTLDANLIWVVLGWAAAIWHKRWERLVVVAIGAAIAYIDWGAGLSHLGWPVMTLLIIQFFPRLPLPRVVSAGVTAVASASFAIYLTHLFVINFMEKKIGVVLPVLTLVLAVIVGLCVARLQEWWLNQYRRPLKRASSPATDTV